MIFLSFAFISLALLAPNQSGELHLPALPLLRPAAPQTSLPPETGKLREALLDAAREAMRRTPSPLHAIHYQGLLDSDPKREATVGALADMTALAQLYGAELVSPDPGRRKRMVEFLVAWARTYEVTGDTINENKLEPMIGAFDLVRDSTDDVSRALMSDFLRKLAATQIDREDRIPNNNWRAKQIKLVGAIGVVLGVPEFVEYAVGATRRYVETSLRPDGSSRDFEERDALHYHVSGLVPLLQWAITAELRGVVSRRDSLYEYTAPNGSSLRASVEFVKPYATGQKTHQEWVNSRVALDRRRAEAGLSKYQPGSVFDPRKTVELFELSSWFDPTHLQVLCKVLQAPESPWPTPTVLLLSRHPRR
jgi:hypothetical protein